MSLFFIKKGDDSGGSYTVRVRRWDNRQKEVSRTESADLFVNY